MLDNLMMMIKVMSWIKALILKVKYRRSWIESSLN